MITKEQDTRLRNALSEAARVGHQATVHWGPGTQSRKCVEEMGELIVALAKPRDDADIVLEVADVIITALQVGMAYCNAAHGDYNPDDLIDALGEKTARLEKRIDESRKADSP